jgi:hypothetical protein
VKSNRRLHVLAMLRAARPGYVTTSQLAAEIMPDGRHLGARYGGRLQELRDQGHRITSERLGESEWAYCLTHDAESSTPTDEPGGEPPAPTESAAGLVGEAHDDSGLTADSPLPHPAPEKPDAAGQDRSGTLFSLAEIDLGLPPKRPAYADHDLPDAA